MLNQHSLEEIADIHNLLVDIKKEYEEGIKPILMKNTPSRFRNPHTVPKLKKIQINRGLGLSAQNTNILKKILKNLKKLQVKNPLLHEQKKQLQDLKFVKIWN